MKRITVRHKDSSIEAVSSKSRCRITLNYIECGDIEDFETWLRASVYLPPHKLKAFGKACMEIAETMMSDA